MYIQKQGVCLHGTGQGWGHRKTSDSQPEVVREGSKRSDPASSSSCAVSPQLCLKGDRCLDKWPMKAEWGSPLIRRLPPASSVASRAWYPQERTKKREDATDNRERTDMGD